MCGNRTAHLQKSYLPHTISFTTANLALPDIGYCVSSNILQIFAIALPEKAFGNACIHKHTTADKNTDMTFSHHSI